MRVTNILTGTKINISPSFDKFIEEKYEHKARPFMIYTDGKKIYCQYRHPRIKY